MNEVLVWALAAAAGLVLGVIFFGGLWWTVRKGVSSRRPALWFLGSLIMRMGIAIAGFYFVGGGEWQRLLACLLGFIVARFVVTIRLRPRQAWLVRPPGKRSSRTKPEVGHAP